MEKPQLHISMIDMLARCGIQFQRRYGARFGVWDEEEIIPPGVALAIGISVHKGVQSNLEYKIDKDQLLTAEQIKDITRDEFQKVWDGGMLLTEEESININNTRDSNIDLSIKLVLLHNNELAPSLNPIAVENWFVIELKDYPYNLSGKIDIIEKDCIRDTKTSGKSPTADVGKSTQMATYSIARKVATGEFPKKIFLDYLIKTKTPKLVTVESKPDPLWIKPLYRRIERTIEIIQSIKKGNQAFMPADPNSWICCEKWCGYAKSCKFWSGR